MLYMVWALTLRINHYKRRPFSPHFIESTKKEKKRNKKKGAKTRFTTYTCTHTCYIQTLIPMPLQHQFESQYPNPLNFELETNQPSIQLASHSTTISLLLHVSVYPWGLIKGRTEWLLWGVCSTQDIRKVVGSLLNFKEDHLSCSKLELGAANSSKLIQKTDWASKYV